MVSPKKPFYLKLVIVPLCMLHAGLLQAQRAGGNEVYLKAGLQHITLLDHQATPLPYEGSGPVAALGFNRFNDRSLLSVNVYGGPSAFQTTSEEFRFYDREMTAISAGLSVSWLRKIREDNRLSVWVGPAVTENVLVDFEGIGPWPYLQALGGLHASARGQYELNENHKLAAEINVPVIAWLTDMPYNQIPRVEGRAPDAVSLFKSSTRLANWNSYQRVDLHLAYDYKISSRWNIKVSYDWAWFHDDRPFDMWTYQGKLTIGTAFTW